MSRNSSRIPGASIRKRTAGCEPRSGREIKVSMAPPLPGISKVSSSMADPPEERACAGVMSYRRAGGSVGLRCEQPGARPSIHAGGPAHCRADFPIDDEVGQLVLLGWVTVDDHQPCSIALRQHGKASRGVNHQGTTEHDE